MDLSVTFSVTLLSKEKIFYLSGESAQLATREHKVIKQTEISIVKIWRKIAIYVGQDFTFFAGRR